MPVLKVVWEFVVMDVYKTRYWMKSWTYRRVQDESLYLYEFLQQAELICGGKKETSGFQTEKGMIGWVGGTREPPYGSRNVQNLQFFELQDICQNSWIDTAEILHFLICTFNLTKGTCKQLMTEIQLCACWNLQGWGELMPLTVFEIYQKMRWMDV